MFYDNGWPKKEGRMGLFVWRLNRIVGIIHKKTLELSEDDRELPIVWSVMHMYSTMQLAKIVALKRGINPELAALTAVFHDCFTLLTGSTEDHGKNAEKYIREIIDDYNSDLSGELAKISEEEMNRIIYAVSVHSNKKEIVNDSLAELMKDVDSLDGFLHGMTIYPGSSRAKRINNLFKELDLDYQIE
ncbi:MAG: HD domain-containing protein [Candidatus Heimdallarchaeota archaeon]|nr:HD domain-containing protein [Candidatus Heimdallarchaeota archaeon]